MYTRLGVAGTVIGLAFIILPFAAQAQQEDLQPVSDQELLRTEIRAALLNDPRSLELAEGELVALVELLADEAEAQEVASDFIPPRPLFVEYIAPLLTPWGTPITQAALYVVILLCLGLSLLLLKRLRAGHHHVAAAAVSMPSQPQPPLAP